MLRKDMVRWAQSQGDAAPEYARYWDKLVFLCPTHDPFNLIDGVRPTVYTSTFRSPTHYGRGFIQSTGQSAVATFAINTKYEPLVNNACTYVAFMEWTGDAANYTSLIGVFNSHCYGIQHTDTDVSMRLRFATAGYVTTSWTSLKSYYNTPLMCVGRWSYGKALTIWIFNAKTGVLIATASSAAVSEAPINGTDITFDLWSHAAASTATVRHFGYGAIWTRALTNNEVYALARFPDAPFRYARRDRATPLYSAIDETRPSQTDHIDLASGSAAYKTQLGSVNTPNAGRVRIELDATWS